MDKLFLENEWKALEVYRKKTYVTKEKLEKLKEILRWWNKDIFWWVDLKVKVVVMELNELDIVISESNNDLKSLLGNKRRKVYNLVWINLKIKESILKKKSRQKWIKEWNLNTRYF